MTEKLYDNGTLYNFDARVIACNKGKNGYEIILGRTAFFAEGGGQAGGTGTIGGVRINDVQDINGESVHYADSAIEVGTEVHCAVDGEIRFRRMQNHTGEHLLTGIIHNRFGYNNVGFHLGSSDVILDLDGQLTDSELRECELAANKAIAEDRAVTISYPDTETLRTLEYRSKLELTENVRLVTIEGYDVCACCAPHVDSTGKIGMIKVISRENYKGGTRIRLLCGLDALDDYNKRLESVYAVSRLISSKPDEIAENVRKLADENAALKFKLNKAERERAEEIISSLKNDDRRSFCIFTSAMNADILRKIANEGVKLTDGMFGIFADKNGGYSYIIASENINMREMSREINETLSGRGGGSPKMIQGSVSADRKTIEEYFKSVRF